MLSGHDTKAITIPFLPRHLSENNVIDGRILDPDQISAYKTWQKKSLSDITLVRKFSKSEHFPYSTILSHSHFFAVGPQIGSGGMGKVRCAQDQDTKQWSALKIVRNRKDARKEVHMLKKANEIEASTPFFTKKSKKHGVYKSYYFMKLKTGTNLFDLLQHTLHPIILCKIAINLIKNCKDLQPLNIFHSDIKPENIMVDPTTGAVELIDFGISIITQKDGTIPHDAELGGTLKYIAPEIWHETCKSTSYDNNPELKEFITAMLECGILPENYLTMPTPIFSAEKMTMYSIGMTLSTLFNFLTPDKLDISLKECNLLNESITKSAFDLMKSMLSPQPEYRPSYQEAIEVLSTIMTRLLDKKHPFNVGILLDVEVPNPTKIMHALHLCIKKEEVSANCDEDYIKAFFARKKNQLEERGYFVSNVAYIYSDTKELAQAIRSHYSDLGSRLKIYHSPQIQQPIKTIVDVPPETSHKHQKSCTV